MNRSALHAAALAAVAATVWAAPSRADETEGESMNVVTTADPELPSAAPPAAPMPYQRSYGAVPVITEEREAPNGALISSGAFLFGASYGTSVVVAAISERESDKKLYIPVAGPWLDLAARGRCAGRAECENETTNKVLLVANGVLQGIGALQMVGGFLFPEKYTEVVRRPTAKGIHVSPTGGVAGAGLTAYGAF